MSFPEQHELHKRRFGRNLGLGVALGSFVVLIFALTVVKLGSDPSLVRINDTSNQPAEGES
ncbi:putative cox locus protein [hydrothermal vent metagenome]|uniref:Putative cox locus protein n=1 Tax=hydrothermal vent metagenome TaxID=652676 RepID=A0A3B0RB13_9ZZZZ